MEEKALQPGNTVPAAPDKRPDFSLADFKEGRVFEWLTGLKSGYQQAMEEQALADLAKELGFKGFARCLREYRKEEPSPCPLSGTMESPNSSTRLWS